MNLDKIIGNTLDELIIKLNREQNIEIVTINKFHGIGFVAIIRRK